jgi:hypothetical protein
LSVVVTPVTLSKSLSVMMAMVATMLRIVAPHDARMSEPTHRGKLIEFTHLSQSC